MPLSRTVAPYSSARQPPPAADPWAQAASTAFHTSYQPDRADLRGDPPPDQGDRPAARGAVVPEPGVGGAGPGLARLAWSGHDSHGGAAAAGAAPPTSPSVTTRGGGGRPDRHASRVVSVIRSPRLPAFPPSVGRHLNNPPGSTASGNHCGCVAVQEVVPGPVEVEVAVPAR